MVPNGDGGIRRVWVVRLRWGCPNPDCRPRSWTAYEVGGYPHRVYTLAVAVRVVARLAADPQATLTSVGREFQCHRCTVARLTRWVGGIGDPHSLARACVRIDPSGLPPPRSPAPDSPRIIRQPSCFDQLALAGHLVLLLEHLARLLRNRGVPLEPGEGLAAILRHQFERFRMVRTLTGLSPPLHAADLLGWG